MPTSWVNFRRDFLGWRRENSPSKFAEKFAGNFPKVRQAKIENLPEIRCAEPRDQ